MWLGNPSLRAGTGAFGRIFKEDIEDHWEEVEEGLDLFREYFFDLCD